MRGLGVLRWIAALLVLGLADPAHAGLTPKVYQQLGVSLPANAALPLDARTTDEAGRQVSFQQLLSGLPAVFVFADYTCTTLCGPIVAFVAAALEHSGLRADRQFRLVVVGLDERDSLADAAQMRRKYLGDSALADATSFVIANGPTIRQLTDALGYRYAYDKENDQFVHPGAAYVLRADGHVSRVLTGLGLSPADMRLALVEAGRGQIGTFGDQVRLLCSGFDPAHGAYNLMISRLLAGGAIATILMLGGGIGLLMLTGRRRAA
jgi:protein SCO1/2